MDRQPAQASICHQNQQPAAAAPLGPLASAAGDNVRKQLPTGIGVDSNARLLHTAAWPNGRDPAPYGYQPAAAPATRWPGPDSGRQLDSESVPSGWFEPLRVLCQPAWRLPRLLNGDSTRRRRLMVAAQRARPMPTSAVTECGRPGRPGLLGARSSGIREAVTMKPHRVL